MTGAGEEQDMLEFDTTVKTGKVILKTAKICLRILGEKVTENHSYPMKDL